MSSSESVQSRSESESVTPGTEDQERVDQPFSESALRVRDFEAEYGIHAPLLPFDYMDMDGFKRVKEITEFLSNRPRSCQYVSKKLLYGPKVLGIGRNSGQALLYPHHYCLISGWWPVEGSKHSEIEYQNPDHYHQSALGTITDPAEQARLFKLTARLGLLSDTDVAPMVGHDSNGHISSLCRRRTGKAWGDLNADGKVRFARTLKTIHAWSDYSYREIDPAFGLPPKTADKRVRDHAPDFWPPKDPSYKQNLEVVLAEVYGDD